MKQRESRHIRATFTQLVRRNSTITRRDSFDLELNQLAQVHVIAQGFLCLWIYFPIYRVINLAATLGRLLIVITTQTNTHTHTHPHPAYMEYFLLLWLLGLSYYYYFPLLLPIKQWYLLTSKYQVIVSKYQLNTKKYMAKQKLNDFACILISSSFECWLAMKKQKTFKLGGFWLNK